VHEGASADWVGDKRANAMLNEWIEDTDEMKRQHMFRLRKLILTPANPRWEGRQELQQDAERFDGVCAGVSVDISVDGLR